jgi:tetratricopeptide (TPR) repeat protein
VRNRPPRAFDWLASLLLVGGMAVAAGARAAEAQDGTVVRDLYWGEVLFQFYRQDDFAALTHLLAARDAGRVPHHEAESELLLGGLYLSYGQHDRAAGIFERLLAGTPEPAVRDRAWYYLGKLRYQRALYGPALEAFARVGPDLPEALAAEFPMLVAQARMATGDFDGAQRVLADWDAPDPWSAYARYNLGVALVRLGRTAEGAALLDRVGRLDAATEEEKDLRDKANLALGYAWLQANDAAAARPVLERVRLRGPFAGKALLGVGWADAAAGDYRAALVPWLELVDRDLMDSAVQESFLAVPYALGRLEAHGTAVARYQRALGAFDGELGRLAAAVERARAGTLLPAMLDGDDPDLGRWYWRMKKIPDSDDSRYLYHLLADHAFQEGFKNYRDLTLLDRHLDDWRQRLETYSGMVDARRAAFAERLPAAEERLAGTDIPALEARRAGLAERLARAEADRDVAVLGDAGQRDRWQRLLAVEADPQFGAADEALRQRHRVLKGVLAWDLDRQFRERAWRERRALAALDRDIAQAAARLESIRAAQAGEPRRFDDFAARIAALTPRILAMQAAIDRTLESQERTLVAMAVRELDAQRERLASYRVQARFALATIYDRAGATQAAATEGAAP